MESLLIFFCFIYISQDSTAILSKYPYVVLDIRLILAFLPFNRLPMPYVTFCSLHSSRHHSIFTQTVKQDSTCPTDSYMNITLRRLVPKLINTSYFWPGVQIQDIHNQLTDADTALVVCVDILKNKPWSQQLPTT